MKINLLAFVTIIGCTASAVRANTCVESTGICVCSGSCPSFTADWGGSRIMSSDSCVVVKGDASISSSNGVVTVNGQTYSPMDPCSDAMAGGSGGGNSAGMVGAYYARAFVAAAAVAGGVAYAI